MGSDENSIRYLSDWQATLDMIHVNTSHYYQFNYASLPASYQGDLSITVVTPLNFENVGQSHVIIAVFNAYFEIFSNDESVIQNSNDNTPIDMFFSSSNNQTTISEGKLHNNSVYVIAVRLKENYTQESVDITNHFDFEYSIAVGTTVAEDSVTVDQLTIGTPTTNTVQKSKMHVYAVEMMRDEILTLFVYSHCNVSLSILIDNYNDEKIYPELALASTHDYWHTHLDFGNQWLTEVVIPWDDPNSCEAIDDRNGNSTTTDDVGSNQVFVNILLLLNIIIIIIINMHHIKLVFLHQKILQNYKMVKLCFHK